MNLKVVRHDADDEKPAYKAILKGEAGDLIDGCLVEVEIRLKAKSDTVLEEFPRGGKFQATITVKEEQ